MTTLEKKLWQAMLSKSFEPRQWFDDDGSQLADSGSKEDLTRRPSMWIYRREEEGRWAVGFYAPDGTWNEESIHLTREKAATRVNWLNGG